MPIVLLAVFHPPYARSPRTPCTARRPSTKVRAAPLPGEEQQFVVSITRDKQVYLNDARLAPDQLTEKLAAISAERPDRQVFVRADEDVPYGDVIRTMAAIKAAGIQNVGMVTAMPDSAAASTAPARRRRSRGSAR